MDDESALNLLSEIASQLAKQSRTNKDFLVKSLRQAVSALSQLEQPLPRDASGKSEAVKKLEAAVNPFCKVIVKHGLLLHKDKDVRLLVAICISEIFRVLAPEPPFEDKYLLDIFKLIVSVFAELADTTSPYFPRRVKVLETIARCKCCVIMLDIDCEGLVLEMFDTIFSVVRENHQQSIVNDMLSIMTHILNEEASQSLLDVILRNLVKEGKGASSASSRLAVSVIQTCAEKLEPLVRGFLTSCILDKDAEVSELKEFYHEIIYNIFQCAPQILLAVIPNLIQELLTDQVDVRIKAVNLIAKLFALPEHHVVKKFHDLFLEFLKRFSDKSAEVRVSALQCAKAVYMANPSTTESHQVLAALEGRLLDFDDRVRVQAVIVVCDLVRSNLKFVPPKLISQATERLRDKKISVRKKALQKLMEVYRDYCSMCSEGHMIISDHFEQIPCKILMLCYDKDCKEFRSQNMELVFAEELFPVLLSVKERTRHWINLFSLFDPLHVKALSSILCQKRRLRTEMQIYLALRKKEKVHDSEELQKRIKTSFTKMSASFPDPSKAEECFNKLDRMKDNNIFNALAQLLDEQKIKNGQATRDKFLKLIGDKHPHFEFLQSLSSKCMFNIFSSEHVCCVLDNLSSNISGSKHMDAASIKLLLGIVSSFPSLLRGSEAQFCMLLEEHSPIDEKLIEVLAKAGPHISIKFSDIYPFLERVCLEGTRTQSKFAIAAIAALVGSSEQFVFTELCKELVNCLHSGRNIPTVLQSLGCMAQYSVTTFESKDGEITPYIYKNIIHVSSSSDLFFSKETFGCSSCKLKIYGLKTLVKSFLPHQGTLVTRKIDDLLKILAKILEKSDTFNEIISCENDKSLIRLASSKCILRLTRRWDLHISPEIFRLTVLMAKDSCSFARRLFLDKTHKLLKEHVIPSRYACVFALAATDCNGDLQDDSFKYMAEYVREYSKKARLCQTSAVQGGSITEYPAYIVVFLVHVLAHDTGFPPEDCQDEEAYAQFCSPLSFVLLMLVNAGTVDGDMDLVNDAVLYLLTIFRAIKKADDAVDAQITPRLHVLADIGISITNALNHSGISSPHPPGLVLLPSSLYRISLPKYSDEAYSSCLPGFNDGEIFIARIKHMFKSHFSLPSSTVPKRGRKCQEDVTHSDVNKFRNLAPSKKVQFSSTLNTGTQNRVGHGIITGRRRKCSVSPTAVGLHNEFSAPIESDAVSNKFQPNVGKEQKLSSCDSVTTKPFRTESQVSTRDVQRNIASLKDVSTSHSIISEPLLRFEGQLKKPCCLKENNDESEALIGQRINIISPIDRRYHSGTVDGFYSQNNTHKITYDNGEVELLCLSSESWETITDDSQVEREIVLPEESDTFNLLQWDDDSEEQNSLPNKENENPSSNRIIPLPGKGKKRQKVFVDTSASKVNNKNVDAVCQRTRGRKHLVS